MASVNKFYLLWMGFIMKQACGVNVECGFIGGSCIGLWYRSVVEKQNILSKQ